MKLCKDCAHSVGTIYGTRCSKGAPNYVIGGADIEDYRSSCQIQRKGTWLWNCGPHARWFEPKTNPLQSPTEFPSQGDRT